MPVSTSRITGRGSVTPGMLRAPDAGRRDAPGGYTAGPSRGPTSTPYTSARDRRPPRPRRSPDPAVRAACRPCQRLGSPDRGGCRRHRRPRATPPAGPGVEHIGSTAVPGLPGKGIVDLSVEADPAAIPGIVEALLGLGFQPQPGPDPWPPTRPMLVGAVVVEGDRVPDPPPRPADRRRHAPGPRVPRRAPEGSRADAPVRRPQDEDHRRLVGRRVPIHAFEDHLDPQRLQAARLPDPGHPAAGHDRDPRRRPARPDAGDGGALARLPGRRPRSGPELSGRPGRRSVRAGRLRRYRGRPAARRRLRRRDVRARARVPRPRARPRHRQGRHPARALRPQAHPGSPRRAPVPRSERGRRRRRGGRSTAPRHWRPGSRRSACRSG